jgi:UDP-N-acetyl-D-mannosaminuronic acid dehydrogenase
LREIASDNRLPEMIKKVEAKIAVVGLGAVGLPTAALFANLGFRVTGIDVNRKIVNQKN